ncbi:MAG: hypothetical protein ACYDCL_18725 [Myxococcales bacterium]
MRKAFNSRWFVNLWIAGLLVSGLSAQGVGQRAFAESTAFGINGGWQREILFFNLFVAALLIQLKRKAGGYERVLTLPLTLLPLCLGLNHLVAALHTGAIGNWEGAVANGAALLYGLLVLTFEKAEQGGSPANATRPT